MTTTINITKYTVTPQDVRSGDTVTVSATAQNTVSVYPAIRYHSNLENLDANDHPQYVLDAGDTMTGDLSFTDAKIDNVDSVDLNTSYIPSGSEPVGSIYWDAANHTYSGVLENGVILQFGKESFIDGQNDTGSTMFNGTPASYQGSIGNSGNFRIKKALASAAEAAYYFIGLLTEDIENGNSGKITTEGKVRGIQTDGVNYGEAWSTGDILYVSGSTAGYLTKTPPNAPIPAIPVAVVISAHATNGTLEVRPTFPYSLEQLTNVDGTAPSVNGDLMSWDNDNGVWNRQTDMYDDIYPSAISFGSTASTPSFTIYNGGNLRAYEFPGTGVLTKEIHVSFQFPHSRKSLTDIGPHIHLYIPDNVAGGDIKFYMDYTWKAVNDTTADTETTISGTVTRGASAGINSNAILSFSNIDGSSVAGVSSILTCRIYRNPADAGDTFAASVWIKSGDIHVSKNTLGSKNISSK